MKPIIVILTTICFSCNVLDQEPEVQISNEIAIKDENSARAALVGLYDALQSEDYYGGYFIVNVDMFSDDVINSAFEPSYRQLNSQIVPSTNLGIELMWMQMYRTINSANHILAKVPLLVQETFTEEERDQLIGTALLIRGLVYFDLLRSYGEHWDLNSSYGVPIRTLPASTADFIPRSTVAQTYQRIRTDLEEAKDKLLVGDSPGYVSKSTANALLARLYLYMKDYALASSYAETVIGAGQYSLSPTYSSIFSRNNSAESIFELNFNFQDPSAFLREYSETKEASIAYELADIFTPEDQRQEMIINDPDQPVLLTTSKYSDQSDPAYIVRLAEMYFIRAEARALGSGSPADGLDDLNVVRARAGMSPLSVDDIPDMNTFLNTLLSEKRKEFYAEGHRFFDLARHQKFSEVYGIENFRSIFPIPFVEINTARNIGISLEQNPGF